MVKISGFADEISDDLDEQLRVLTDLGMDHICLRGVNGRSFSEFSLTDVRDVVIPKLTLYGVKVSSIGSPLGKIPVDDETGFQHQLKMLKNLCEFGKILNCRFIRIFSFNIPEGHDPDLYADSVIAKIKAFEAIAATHDMVLLHENEKDIFGDTAARCKLLLKAVNTPHFRGIFDFANFVQVGQDPTTAYDLLHDYVDYIHIKDARFDAPYNVVCGEGDGEIPTLLARFLAKGYDGFLTLEPHLAMFGMLAGLEQNEVDKIVHDKDLTGAEGYALQYKALTEILRNIGA